MSGPLIRREPPEGQAVNLDELKAALRIEGSHDDARLAQLIRSETARYEDFTGRFMLPTELRLTLDRWCATVRLPAVPLRAVAEVSYLDPEHAERVLSAQAWYLTEAVPFWSIGFELWAAMPGLSDRPAPVRVDFSAGQDAPGGEATSLLAPRADDQSAIIHMVGVAYDQGQPMPMAEMRRIFGHRRVAGW
ncbi:head-tail connector protein [Pseudooceanicola sp. 502str34]